MHPFDDREVAAAEWAGAGSASMIPLTLRRDRRASLGGDADGPGDADASSVDGAGRSSTPATVGPGGLFVASSASGSTATTSPRPRVDAGAVAVLPRDRSRTLPCRRGRRPAGRARPAGPRTCVDRRPDGLRVVGAHRLPGQDRAPRTCSPGARRPPAPTVATGRQPQQRARRAADRAAGSTRDDPLPRRRDGRPRRSATSPTSCAIAPPDGRRRAQRRHRPRRRVRLAGRRSPQAKGELVEALPADGHRRAQRRRPAGGRDGGAHRRRGSLHVRRAARDADVRVARRRARRARAARRSTLGHGGGAAHRSACGLLGAHQVAQRRRRRRRRRSPLGVDLDDGRRGARRPPRPSAAGGWRSPSAPTASTVVNDAYNANPDSMRGRARRRWPRIGDAPARRTVAVLGEMLELGDEPTRARTPRSGGSPRGAGVDVLVVGRRRRRGAIARGAPAEARRHGVRVATADARRGAGAGCARMLARRRRRPGQGVAGRSAGTRRRRPAATRPTAEEPTR